jgi:hypothetical protein
MNGSRLFGPVAGLLLVAVLVPPLKRFKKPKAHSKDKGQCKLTRNRQTTG